MGKFRYLLISPYRNSVLYFALPEAGGGTIYHNFGLGFRIHNVNHPITFGLAAIHEGLKLFTSIDIGKVW